MENSELKTGATVLKDQIEYQNGTIVSKQLIKKQNGNVTIFAFSKDENLSEHTSPFEAMVFIADGEMEIKIGGVPHTVKKDEMIMLPAGVPHGLVALTDAKMMLIMIKG
ncbi:MAG: cupin domain-containing protein [Ignavibacteriaceae bacterium]|nr:cupin domain-containing protein [Ignavibacteriaceae bacterium]